MSDGHVISGWEDMEPGKLYATADGGWAVLLPPGCLKTVWELDETSAEDEGEAG